MIDENLLLQSGATLEHYPAKELIYSKGSLPRFYYQIFSGSIELNDDSPDGAEFTYEILYTGQSIGEAFLLAEKPYPVDAITKTDSKVWKLCRLKFLDLIHTRKELATKLYRRIADRLDNSYMMLYSNSRLDPSYRIESLMNLYKNQLGNDQEDFEVPFTRQQIANMTGLRVETVIRAVKKMQHDKVLKIEGGKIFY